MKSLNVILFLLFFVFPSQASDDPDEPFYDERERGWFWHEAIPDEVEKKPEEISALRASPSPDEKEKMIPLDVKWLKDNIDNLMSNAINKPTPENLAAYAYAQRLMLDLGSRFSTKITQFIKMEESLDETNRRPMAQFALNSFKSEHRISIRDVFDKVKSRSGFWFFYSSDCEYCMKQISVIRQIKAQYNIDVLAISLDGGILPGMETFDVIPDVERIVADKFNVEVTPAIYLVDNKNAEVIKMTEGLHSQKDIEDRMMLIARDKKFITEEEFMLAQGVRELNIFKNSNGEVLASAKRLDQDPGYLADLLREKLKEVKPYGALRILPTSEEELKKRK